MHIVTYCNDLAALRQWMTDNANTYPQLRAKNSGVGSTGDVGCCIVGVHHEVVYSVDETKSLALVIGADQATVDLITASPLEVLAQGVCGEADCPFNAIETTPALLTKYREVYDPDNNADPDDVANWNEAEDGPYPTAPFAFVFV